MVLDDEPMFIQRFPRYVLRYTEKRTGQAPRVDACSCPLLFLKSDEQSFDFFIIDYELGQGKTGVGIIQEKNLNPSSVAIYTGNIDNITQADRLFCKNNGISIFEKPNNEEVTEHAICCILGKK